MLKNIVGTAGTRVLNAFFTLVILWLMTNFIGKAGVGTIGLIIVDITVLQLIYDILAGNPLIYFTSRASLRLLLLPAYLWILSVTVLTVLIFYLLFLYLPDIYQTIVPPGFGIQIIILALVNGFMQVHYNLLIGQQRIKAYNLLFIFQIVVVLTVFAILVHSGGSPADYLIALFTGWGTSALIGFFLVISVKSEKVSAGWKEVSSEVFRFGKVGFAANILHLGNKRFSFYVIKAFAGLPALGLYNAGAQLSEGVRIIGQSISLVQYTSISGMRDDTHARILTVRLMKVSVVLTFFALLILISIPSAVYGLVFSNGFKEIKTVLLLLFPGVLALSANTVFSHYFSGMGRPGVNLRSNIVGFAVTLPAAFLLIPFFGFSGAAITASLSYLSSVVYQYFVFVKGNPLPLKSWLIRKSDIRELKNALREAYKQKKEQV